MTPLNEVERPLTGEKRPWHEEILLVRYHDSTQTERSSKAVAAVSDTIVVAAYGCRPIAPREYSEQRQLFFGGRNPSGYRFIAARLLDECLSLT
jgi:hypothetical protein